jgi:hypothetical protein
MLAPELDVALRATQRSFVRHTKNGCPAAFGLRSSDDSGCEKFAPAAFQDIVSSGVSTIIVASRWQLYSERGGFDNGEGGVEVHPLRIAALADSFGLDPSALKRNVLRRYTESLQALVATGRRVILVYPVPEAGWDVPSYLARRMWFDGEHLRDLSTSLAAYRLRTRDTERALDAVGEHPNLLRIRPAAICAARARPAAAWFTWTACRCTSTPVTMTAPARGPDRRRDHRAAGVGSTARPLVLIDNLRSIQ